MQRRRRQVVVVGGNADPPPRLRPCLFAPRLGLAAAAAQGVRFGRNRVNVLAHDFRQATYDREGWTVVMRRIRPLPAGIATHGTEPAAPPCGSTTRGRPDRAGRNLRWSWRILRKPSSWAGPAAAAPQARFPRPLLPGRDRQRDATAASSLSGISSSRAQLCAYSDSGLVVVALSRGPVPAHGRSAQHRESSHRVVHRP